MRPLRRLTLAATAVALALSACDGGTKPEAPAERAASAPDDPRSAYDRGLDFLGSKAHDGVFSMREHESPGITGLCALAMLERPGGPRAKDADVLRGAYEFLAKSLGGDGGVKAELTSNYETSLVVETLARSGLPKYAEDVRRGVRYVESLQFGPTSKDSYGGTGMGPTTPRADLANTYYTAMALRAAGSGKDTPFFRSLPVFLGRCQNRKANETPGEPTEWRNERGERVVRADDGGAVSWPGDSKAGKDAGPDGSVVPRSYGSMTFALVHCFHLAGVDATDDRVKAALAWIGGHWDLDTNPGMIERQKIYGLYYYYAAIAKTLSAIGVDALHAPDGRAIDWRHDLAQALLARQKPDGSWQSKDNMWWESVSVLATAYALRALGPCIR